MPLHNHQIIIRADKTPAGEHDRRFNAPTVDEVAVIMVGAECEKRDIVLHRRDSVLERVSETHKSYDALQCPLIFVEGEDGYNFNVMQQNPNTNALSIKKVS